MHIRVLRQAADGPVKRLPYSIPISRVDMTMWLFQLALIIAVCACFGRIAEQLGQCRVVGEIAAGIFLGPSVVGGISPRFYDLMFGAAASSGMSQLGEVGVVLLMFQIGLHMDFGAGPAGRS